MESGKFGRRLNAWAQSFLLAGKSMQAPAGGWTARSFATEGPGVVRFLHRNAQVSWRRNVPALARAISQLVKDRVSVMVETATGGRVKGAVEVQLPNDFELWAEALRTAFDEIGVEATVDLVKPIQSTLGQGYSRTANTTGAVVRSSANRTLANEAQGIARRIARIDENTRDIYERAIRKALDEGLPALETARVLKRTIPELADSRATTIARTELSRAYNQGAIAAMKATPGLTHISVIGCQSREKERWNSPSYQQFMYRGESTCNIQHVPIEDAEELNFHPNHTGTIVPDSFADEAPSAGPTVQPQPPAGRGTAPGTVPRLPPAESIAEPKPKPALGQSLGIHPGDTLDTPLAGQPVLRGQVTLDSFKDAEGNWSGGPWVEDDWAKIIGLKPMEFADEMFGNMPKTVNGARFERNMGKLDTSVRVNQTTKAIDRAEISASAVFSNGRGDRATVMRQFTWKRGEGWSVYHDFFELTGGIQGAGIAKQVIGRQMSLYQRMGVKKITVYAALDRGGYAWARYGFLPADVDEWRRIKGRLRYAIDNMNEAVIDPEVTGTTWAKVKAALEKILESDNPETLWQISDLRMPTTHMDKNDKPMSLGKVLLSGESWHGELKLSSTKQMARFQAFVKPRS